MRGAQAPTLVRNVDTIEVPTSAEDLAVELAATPALPVDKSQRYQLSNREQAEAKVRNEHLVELRTTRKRKVPAGGVKSGGVHYENIPLLECADIMDDMVDRACSEPAMFNNLRKSLAGAPLRVATMCSGTESPLLALDEVKACEFTTSVIMHANSDQPTALAARGANLRYEHCFSAEIEPYKQAYIQANFAPKTIFSDVNELCNSTA